MNSDVLLPKNVVETLKDLIMQFDEKSRPFDKLFKAQTNTNKVNGDVLWIKVPVKSGNKKWFPLRRLSVRQDNVVNPGMVVPNKKFWNGFTKTTMPLQIRIFKTNKGNYRALGIDSTTVWFGTRDKSNKYHNPFKETLFDTKDNYMNKVENLNVDKNFMPLTLDIGDTVVFESKTSIFYGRLWRIVGYTEAKDKIQIAPLNSMSDKQLQITTNTLMKSKMKVIHSSII